MNRIKAFLAVTVAVALSSVAAMAQSGYPATGSTLAWAGSGKAITTNTSYFVTSANYWPASVDYIHATGDNALVALKFFTVTGSPITVSANLAAGLTNILTSGHIGQLVSGDTIVIRSLANDTYQLAKVHLTNSTGIILTNNGGLSGANNLTCPTDFALVSGDLIYEMTQAAAITHGNATAAYPTTVANGPIFNFQDGKPGLVLLHLPSTQCTNAIINLISGKYLRPPGKF